MTNLFLPRGVRNNNPGNIRIAAKPWQGEIKGDGRERDFAVFATPVMGLRALMRLLLTYHVKYGLDTIESLINRYAPPVENATDHYINHVVRQVHIGRKTPLSLTDPVVLKAVARAIVIHENGFPPPDFPDGWYLPKMYDEAVVMALKK